MLSNQVGTRYVLLQLSNGRFQNNMYPNQELEGMFVLEGPYPVRRWEGHGQGRVMRNISPTVSAPIYEGDADIDFI